MHLIPLGSENAIIWDFICPQYFHDYVYSYCWHKYILQQAEIEIQNY